MENKINFIALIAGILTILLIAISMFIPWWQFTAGNNQTPNALQVNFSPVNLNFVINGTPLAIPLIAALNIACLLTILSGAIVLIIYSIKPKQPYSSRLLGFGYKKPLYILIAFITELIALPIIAQTFAGLAMPLSGAATIILPQKLVQDGPAVSVNFVATLQWPFYLAIAATVLSIAARIYHRKITKSSTTLPSPPQI